MELAELSAFQPGLHEITSKKRQHSSEDRNAPDLRSEITIAIADADKPFHPSRVSTLKMLGT